MDLFKDIIASINTKKGHVFKDADPGAEKEYQPFIVNKALSFSPQTVLAANEMNKRPELHARAQYDFLYEICPKGRFQKWIKAEDINTLEAVKEYYGYTDKKAKEVLKVLPQDKIDIIVQRMDRGDISKR